MQYFAPADMIDEIMAQNKIMISRNNIDEKTMRQMMGHLKVDDHDLFAGYVRRLGIEHQDWTTTAESRHS